MPKKKKKKTLTIDISVQKEYVVPKNMEIWSKDAPMSKKCVKLIEELSTVIAYVAKRLNEGPELEKNVIKRCSALKALTQLLLTNTFIDNFHRYGILRQIEVDIMNRQRMPTITLVRQEKSIPKKETYIS